MSRRPASQQTRAGSRSNIVEMMRLAGATPGVATSRGVFTAPSDARIRCHMGAFDDAADHELGAACARLAAWVEPLPAGALIDAASGLTERDLAMILRHLHATRKGQPDVRAADDVSTLGARPSVPITAKDR